MAVAGSGAKLIVRDELPVVPAGNVAGGSNTDHVPNWPGETVKIPPAEAKELMISTEIVVPETSIDTPVHGEP